MAYDIGARLGIEGEKAFNDSLKAVNAQIKALGAEMTAVTASFLKNADSQQSLAAKNEVLNRSIEVTRSKTEILNKEIASQKEKLDSLGQALDKAAKKSGENSDEALKAQNAYNSQAKKVNDLAAQLNKAEAELASMTNAVEENSRAMEGSGQSMDELADGVKRAGDSMEDAGKAGLSFGDILKANVLSDAIAAGARKLAESLRAVADAALDLGRQSLEGFSQFEQLSGGIKTLFGTEAGSLEEYAQSVGKSVDEVSGEYERLLASQQTVFSNADKAFQTAGLSANEYMETVTSFSASLIQGLGGDTEAAAQLADQAIIDMADNANKMGTDMESIQNAYQGFAKRNFDMLDNLKLGYGGTQAEMVRLINDSGILNETISNLDNVSFDQMIQAIHAVQTDMGITGTTAKEAASTIEGSTNSMKAAWENLVTGLASGDADLSGLMSNFTESVATAGENILPRVETILENMGTLVEQMLPQITEQIPPLVETVIPPLVAAGGKLLGGLASGIAQAVPGLLEQAGAALAGLQDSFLQLVPTLSQGLREKAPDFIASGLELLSGLSASLRENVGLLVDAALDLVKSLAQGIADGIPDIIEKGPEIVSNLANTINDNAPKILKAAFDIIVTLGKGLIDAIPTLIANIPQIFSAIVDTWFALNWLSLGKNAITFLKDGITNMIPQLKTAGKNVLDAVVNAVKQLPQTLLEIGKNGLSGLVNAIKSFAGAAKSAMSAVATGILNEIKALPSKALEIGKNIISGIVNGIKNGAAAAVKAVTDLAGNLLGKAKEALGIHSPSRKFKEEVGEYIGLGVAEGISNSSDKAVKAADEMAKDVFTRSKDWADRQTKYMNLSFQEQLELWETIQGQFIEGSKQYAQAEEKIYDLKQKYQAEYYDSLKTTADRQAKYQKATLQEQLATWRGIQDQFIEGSKQYAEAEEKIYDLRAQVQAEFYQKIEDANKKVAELQNEYYDAMEKRQEQIANAYGLFDKVSEREEISGKDLLHNLQDQVSVMKSFYKGLDKLEERGVGSAIVDEIRAMGPSAESELHALLGLTDRELDQYANIYKEKQQLANRVALDELKDLKAQTDAEIASQINDLRSYYSQNAPEIGRSFTIGLADGMWSGLSTLASVSRDVGQTIMSSVAGAIGSGPYADLADTMVQSGGGVPEGYERAQEALEMATRVFGDRMAKGELITLGELQEAFGGMMDGMEVRMDGQKVGQITGKHQKNYNRAYDI